MKSIEKRSCAARVRRKASRHGGFSLMEMLMSVLVISFLSVMVVTGTQLAVEANETLADAANAEALMSTCITMLRTEFETATAVTVEADGSISYQRGNSGYVVEMRSGVENPSNGTGGGTGGTVVAGDGTDYFPEGNGGTEYSAEGNVDTGDDFAQTVSTGTASAGSASQTAGAGTVSGPTVVTKEEEKVEQLWITEYGEERPFISDVTATGGLSISYSSISWSEGTFTVKDLAVRKPGTTEPLAYLDTLIISGCSD